MSKYSVHELALLIPEMSSDEYVELKEDIRANGLLTPITLYQTKILDGRHRYKICQELEIEATFDEYKGETPARFVLSKNIFRRHLQAGQKGMIADDFREPIRLENAKNVGGRGNKVPQNSGEVSNPHERETDAIIGKMVGASAETVRQSRNLKEKNPELAEKVRKGEISLHEATRNIHVSNNSGENEWYTPSQYIEAARATMGSIDVDPASSDKANETVKAQIYYTKETNGLKQKWQGNTWVNPPYAQPLIDEFSQAIINKYISGEIQQACILVNNATDTNWLQRILTICSAVCFIKGRVRFIGIDGNFGAPLQGQVVVYLGKNAKSFSKQFEKFGIILWQNVGE